MDLKRIELVGFKSFPEKIRVDFGQGVTAIVGPNGSGKSNISDAVRWVLGEQSAKTLRGAKMEDVIFAGTQRRKPLGFAQVTLVLDNKDRQMDIDYDEVAIRRRLFRSGESEYAINDGRCRLRDVQELLMDTGIGKDGYSLIGQGQIDQLLSSKPQDRRMVFEEAAGITKYKTRREQAQKQLLEEQDRLDRVSDILTEIGSRLEPLAAQAEVAKQYLSLKEELKFYEVSAFIGEYEQLQEQFNKVDKELSDLNEQIEDSKEKRRLAKERSDALVTESSEARRVLRDLTNEQAQVKVDQEKADGELRLYEQQKLHQEEESGSLVRRIEELKNQIHERTLTLDKEKARIKSLDDEIEAAKTALSSKDAELISKQTIIEEQNDKIREIRHSLSLAQLKLTELTVEAEKQKQILEQDQQVSENYEQEKAALAKEVETTAVNAETSAKKLEEFSAEYQNTYEKTQKAQEAYQELVSTLEADQRLAESMLLQMKDSTKRIQWMQGMENDYEGFTGPVRMVMKLKNQTSLGIHGTLSDVIHVEKKYITALETALGMAVQNIVVENTQAAKRLIAYLREHNGGRATFLPLDSVTGRSSQNQKDAVLAMPGVLGIGTELAQYDSKYRKIVERLLGNVVVAASFDEASVVSKRFGNIYRVVTLEGDIFNIGGSITGGSTKMKNSGILSRHGELETLQKKLVELRKEADEAQERIRVAREQKEVAGQELAELRNRRETLFTETEKARSRKEQQQYLLEQASSRLKDLEDSFGRSGEIGRMHQQKEEESRLALSEHQKTIEALKQRESEEEENYRMLLQALEKEREEKNKASVTVGGLLQQKKFMEQSLVWETDEIEKLSAQTEGLLEKQQDLRDSRKNADTLIENAKLQKQMFLERIEALEKSIEAQSHLVEETNSKREESLKEADETLQQFAQLEKEQVRLENSSNRAKNNLDELQERMWEEYEITYQVAKDIVSGNSAGEMAQDERMSLASDMSKTKRHQTILRLKKEIRDLGPVNVAAIDEYKSLSERSEFLTRQRDDIVRSEENLTEIILKMTEKMEKQFEQGFASIAKTFDEVFQKIFGGGHGILRMTEGENSLEAGIEIIGQPPGKKVSSMTSLSGGERALTAIALLFAIQQQHPAAFCILDEIEAALDDANVERYAHFLKTMADTTQFIVITHRKGTMMVADTMYGVTMEEKGVSKCISVQFTA